MYTFNRHISISFFSIRCKCFYTKIIRRVFIYISFFIKTLSIKPTNSPVPYYSFEFFSCSHTCSIFSIKRCLICRYNNWICCSRSKLNWITQLYCIYTSILCITSSRCCNLFSSTKWIIKIGQISININSIFYICYLWHWYRYSL